MESVEKWCARAASVSKAITSHAHKCRAWRVSTSRRRAWRLYKGPSSKTYISKYGDQRALTSRTRAWRLHQKG